MDLEFFNLQKDKARTLYRAQKVIYSPFFKKNIRFTAKGFHHLEFSMGRKRTEREQLFKFRFLHLAIEIIKTSTTIQEYRTVTNSMGEIIEYWGMVAIIGENNFKIRTVLRRLEGGDVSFWSVMPYSKIIKNLQKLYDEALIENS